MFWFDIPNTQHEQKMSDISPRSMWASPHSQILRLSSRPAEYSIRLPDPTNTTSGTTAWSACVPLNMQVDIVTSSERPPGGIFHTILLLSLQRLFNWLWDTIIMRRSVYVVAIYDFAPKASTHRIYGVYDRLRTAERTLDIVLTQHFQRRKTHNAGIQELHTGTAPFLMAKGPGGRDVVGVILKVDVRSF